MIIHDLCSTVESFLPLDLYHPSLSLIIKNASPSLFSHRATRRNFKYDDYNSICYFLGLVNWDNDLNDLSADDSVNFLYSRLNDVIDRFVPSQLS